MGEDCSDRGGNHCSRTKGTRNRIGAQRWLDLAMAHSGPQGGIAAMKYQINSGESKFDIDIDREGVIRMAGEVIEADLQKVIDPSLYSLILSKRSFELRIDQIEEAYQVQIKGLTINVTVEDERAKLLAGAKSAATTDAREVVIKSPMPGVIIDLPVQQGDQVEAGQLLVAVESMKMHNEFSAPRAGIVKAVRVKSGEKVVQNTILITII